MGQHISNSRRAILHAAGLAIVEALQLDPDETRRLRKLLVQHLVPLPSDAQAKAVAAVLEQVAADLVKGGGLQLSQRYRWTKYVSCLRRRAVHGGGGAGEHVRI